MRNILVFVESRYKVDRKRIKQVVNRFLDQERLRSNYEVSIAIVGDRKMKGFNKKYRNKNEMTTVLAFPLVGFVFPADKVLRLGDVIISYPQAVARAAEDEMLVDDKIEELLIHGLSNLLGKGEIK